MKAKTMSEKIIVGLVVTKSILRLYLQDLGKPTTSEAILIQDTRLMAWPE